MFAGLKNKIKEETGSDPTMLPPLPTQKSALPTMRGRHSRRESGSSVGSASLDGVLDDRCASPVSLSQQDSTELRLADGKVITPKEVKKLEKREEEWRKKLQKKDEEWNKKFEKKEDEFKKMMREKEEDWVRSIEILEKEKSVLEEEKLDVIRQKLALEESLRTAEDYKKKFFQYQEDIDQLEGFQTQEMAKIKHLLLVKEQEISEKVNSLKESSAQIETLKSEVNRLRRYEEEFDNLQDEMESLRHSSDRERSQLSSKLAQSEEEVRHLQDRVAVLEQRTNSDCMNLGAELSIDERVQALLGERALLERRLEEAHLHLSDIKTSWSEKIASLETQVGRLCRQAGEEGVERRRAENERNALLERIKALEVIVERGRSAAREKDEMLARVREERDALADELKEVKTERDREVEDLQRQIESATRESESMKGRLQELEKQIEDLEVECTSLGTSLEAEKNVNTSLSEDVTQLKQNLEAEKTHSANVDLQLQKERDEKDVALMRNAEVSQQGELARQQVREQEQEVLELQRRVSDLEHDLLQRDEQLEQLAQRLHDLEALEHDKQAAAATEYALRQGVSQLEEQLADRNKQIKILQQRLGDMKKTLQKELRCPSQSLDGSDPEPMSTAVLDPSSSKQLQHSRPHQPTITNHHTQNDDDINFTYLKHVLIKFLTSRECEAQHLTRAVATLLRFSPEEERLLRETLEYRMSWFGTRPHLGNGQTAKTIPPS